jgi:hypothetical protein
VTVAIFDRYSIRLLIAETAVWHHRAQLSLQREDHPAARHAYEMRETLARYIAARSDLNYHEARARAIIAARLD